MSCAPEPPPALTAFPEISELPERTELPSLFESFNSKHVAKTKADWNDWRRPQLLALFDHYVYGARPARVEVSATRTASYDDLVPGARWEEWDLTLGNDPLAVLHVAVISPLNAAAPPPVVLGLNKCGNQSLVADPRVRLTTSLVIPACGTSAAQTRGAQSSLWPLQRIIARGVAVVTFHESDAAPDDDEKFSTMLRARFRPDGAAPRASWGTLSIWAWALAHTARWIDSRDELDKTRTAVFGHSRRGKAALLSGLIATSELDAVIAHQSGTGGAALNRSAEGETIELINLAFPHWFDDVYPGFANAETKTPVDQHQLLAVWAPRRVVLVDGDEDRWADPDGSRAAAEAAAPAWELFGQPSAVTWQSRPGMHSVEPSDWELFLDALGW